MQLYNAMPSSSHLHYEGWRFQDNIHVCDFHDALWTPFPSTHHPPMDPQTKQLTDNWTITILFDMILIISMIFMKKTA